MKNPLFRLFERSWAAVAASIAITLFATPLIHAKPVLYEWKGPDGGEWGTTTNWSPTTAWRPGYSGRETTSDAALISGNLTVNSSYQIIFSGIPADAGKKGEFNALELNNGARLITSSAVRITSAEGVSRNVLISEGSALISNRDDTNGLQIGSAGSTETSSIWTISGEVSSKQIIAYTSDATDPTLNGGFIINIDKGSLTARESFNWRFTAKGRTNAVGEIHIFNGGTAILGEMLNFSHSSGYFINFADGTGSLEFSYGGYATRDSVQSLIDTNYIRKGSSITGGFDIYDTGNGWRISVSSVPETSTYGLLMAAATLAICCILKRRN